MEIKIEKLSKKFDDNHVLKDINLVIEKNKSTIILGKSGCGKSVLLKLIYQLIQNDEGSILYDKKKFVDIDKFGMLFQYGALFDSHTIADNIAFVDFIDGGGDSANFSTADKHGHGTAMASLINGATYGIAGDAKIGIAKISDPSVDGGAIKLPNVLDAFKAINMVDLGLESLIQAPTICMAWSFAKSQLLDRYVDFMHTRQGFLMVAAAGNNGGDVDNFSPAGINKILTVGASDASDNVPSFSNDAGTVVEQGTGLQTNGGEEVDVFAPGVSVNIASISNRANDGDYTGVTGDDLKTSASGTSISCAIVAGIGALTAERFGSGKATADALKDHIVEQSLTGLLFQDPGLYSDTPNNVVFVENEYYATVWNTAAGNLGDFLLTDAGSIDISLDVANTVTTIESSDFASLPPALVLNGNASAGWNITANTSVTGALSNTVIYNFILQATKNDNTKFNRHFTVSMFGSNGITEDERNIGSETYFVNEGGTLSEVVYGSGQYAFGRFQQQK